MTTRSSSPYEYLDWGGPQGAPVLHFAHGNGFPPETYSQFLLPFRKKYRVLTWEAFGDRFPLTPDDLHHWRQLAEHMTGLFSMIKTRPHILIGHSLGAVLSFYAACEPSRSRISLVMIDPVIFNRQFLFFWRFMKRYARMKTIPLAKMTRKKRAKWPSRQAVFTSYRQRPLFRQWQDGPYQDYINAAFRLETDGSCGLRYDRMWEAKIFDTTPDDFWTTFPQSGTLDAVPTLIIRGGRSNTFTRRACRQLMKKLPHACCSVHRGLSHCLPMEAPDQLAEEILTWLSLSKSLSKSNSGSKHEGG